MEQSSVKAGDHHLGWKICPVPQQPPQHLRRLGRRCSLQRLSTATLSRAASFPASSSRPCRLSGTKAMSVTTIPWASFT